MEQIASIRGKNKITLDGYVYVKQKPLANNATSYECELRRGSGIGLSVCKAKVKIAADMSVVGFMNTHSHAPNDAHCEVQKVRAGIKRRAEQTDEGAQQILGHELQHLSQQAAVEMAPLSIIRRAIRSAKQKRNAVHPLPTDRTFAIPDEYKTLENGEAFLLHDSGIQDPSRILIFGTARTTRLLVQAQHWFLDGTFKIVPELFYQLYTVHALISGDVIPCLYVLLPNKTQATYLRLFQEMKALVPDLQPSTMTMDFEKASMNAAIAIFPTVSIHGCFYHLAQNIYRQVQAVGLQERYRTDEDLALTTRMLPALAFVPANQVVDSFETLQEQAPDELTPVMDYFEDNYIGRLRRQGRRAAPTFAIAVWNVHNQVEENLPRTNNSVEGYHRKMQTAVSAHHPNIWRFLNILKREQSVNNTYLDQLLGGHAPPPQRKKYRDNNTRISRIVRDFGQRDRLDYLRGIAHNISF
jgi:hypothetical protein